MIRNVRAYKMCFEFGVWEPVFAMHPIVINDKEIWLEFFMQKMERYLDSDVLTSVDRRLPNEGEVEAYFRTNNIK